MQINYDVGDVVVCVNAHSAPMLRQGGMYRVSRFLEGNFINDQLGSHDITVFIKEAHPGKGRLGFHPRRFKKLPKADSEFTEQMRKLKPHKQKVDA